jgi:transposase-like protein
MKSLTQSIQTYVKEKACERINEAIQPGTLQHIFEQEVNSIITKTLNAQLVSERDKFLNRKPYERNSGSTSRNGFKSTVIPGIGGPLTLLRPVIRKGTLRLPLLSALKQAGTRLGEMLSISFWLRGASTRAVAAEINAAMGTRFSHATVSKLSNTLEPALREWEQRPLPPGIVYLYVDAIYFPVRRPGFTSKQAILAALGLDAQGNRYFLGYLLGDRESEDSWSSFIESLLAHGLNRESLRLVISDEHKGIEAAVAKCLAVTHQFCAIHKMRNVLHRVASPDKPSFRKDFKDVYWAANREAARQALGRLEVRWGKAYPKAVELTVNRFEDFTRFFDQPSQFWTVLRSSNLIERFNRELRRRFRSAGAMHSELEVTKLVWAVSEAQEQRWEKRRLWTPRTVQKLQEAA